jgi:hypothetical protein
MVAVLVVCIQLKLAGDGVVAELHNKLAVRSALPANLPVIGLN